MHPDPRKVSFTTAIVSGNDKGKAWGFNEYGHFDLDGPRAKKLREVEWRTFRMPSRLGTSAIGVLDGSHR